MVDVILDDVLREFVGSEVADDPALEMDLAEAIALVDTYYAAQRLTPETVVPDVVMARAYREVTADLFNRRRAPNGILNQQYATETGSQAVPIRIGRDPLAPVYPLLAPWVLPVGFA